MRIFIIIYENKVKNCMCSQRDIGDTQSCLADISPMSHLNPLWIQWHCRSRSQRYAAYRYRLRAPYVNTASEKKDTINRNEKKEISTTKIMRQVIV